MSGDAFLLLAVELHALAGGKVWGHVDPKRCVDGARVTLQGRQARITALSLKAGHARLLDAHLAGNVGLGEAEAIPQANERVDHTVSSLGVLEGSAGLGVLERACKE